MANIQVRHVLADPRSRAALASAVDAGNQAAAVIVSDALWLSGTGAVVGEAAGPAGDQGPAEAPLAAGSGGALPGGASLPDALRMDAAVLAVQLNLRILEEVGALPVLLGSQLQAQEVPCRSCTCSCACSGPAY